MTQAARDRTEYVEISGTAAERAAFTNPKQAMEWYETDTTARYKYMSGAWVSLVASGGAAPGYGGGGGGGGSVSIADGADVSQGAKADAPAASAWYNTSATLIAKIGLLIAISLGAGSHVYGYNGSGQLVTDTWTLLGVARIKTYTYTSGLLTSESDWV